MYHNYVYIINKCANKSSYSPLQNSAEKQRTPVVASSLAYGYRKLSIWVQSLSFYTAPRQEVNQLAIHCIQHISESHKTCRPAIKPLKMLSK